MATLKELDNLLDKPIKTDKDRLLDALQGLADATSFKRNLNGIAQLIRELIKIVRETKRSTEGELQAIKAFASDTIKDLDSLSKEQREELQTKFDKELSRHIKLTNEESEKLHRRLEKTVSNLKPIKGDKGDPGEDADPQVIADLLKSDDEFLDAVMGEDGNLIEAETLRDKLEELEGDNRLDKKAIKGLEILDEGRLDSFVRGRIPTPRYAPRPFEDDLSGDTDGSNKTFTLTKAPDSDYPIDLRGSDFPYALRKTVDFTVAGKTLTLTSAVDAPSNGATLIISYFQ